MVTKVDNDLVLHLTADEAYTLQTLVGFVAGDKECYSVSNKLVELTGEEMGMDYDRLAMYVEGESTGKFVELEDEQNYVIRIN